MGFNRFLGELFAKCEIFFRVVIFIEPRLPIQCNYCNFFKLAVQWPCYFTMISSFDSKKFDFLLKKDWIHGRYYSLLFDKKVWKINFSKQKYFLSVTSSNFGLLCNRSCESCDEILWFRHVTLIWLELTPVSKILNFINPRQLIALTVSNSQSGFIHWYFIVETAQNHGSHDQNVTLKI